MGFMPKTVPPPDPDLLEVYRDWVNEIMDHGSSLTTWEQSFMTSITQFLDKGLMLTEKQATVLEGIYRDKVD